MFTFYSSKGRGTCRICKAKLLPKAWCLRVSLFRAQALVHWECLVYAQGRAFLEYVKA